MVHGLSVFSLQLCQAHFKMILTDKPTIRATGGKNEKKKVEWTRMLMLFTEKKKFWTL